ncbi:MAG TPA: exodeoxyribonuclease VII large subunit [Acidimicrobiales bacterium]
MPSSSASAPSSGGTRRLFDPEAPPVGGDESLDGGARGPEGPEAEERKGVLSIGGLYDEVEAALAQSFPRRRHLWVRGEIQHLSDHRSGHLYLDLVDPEEESASGTGAAGRRGRSAGRGGEPVLKVKCWRTSWAPLRHSLAKEGIELAEGMVVVLRGSLDLYRARGELSLTLADIDVTALLGRMAAQRTKLLATLEAEGLLRRNAGVALPDVVLHVGLVASPETEGCRDFLGQLVGSGFGFRVSHVKVPVQGPGAPASIARAVSMLGRSGCDVIAVVRGGGGRGDLAAFESEVVARAVASARVQVWTGIGHTGDQSVADVVAARACITPTECGQALVARTAQWWAVRVVAPAEFLAGRVPSFLADAAARDVRARGRLTAAARQQLRVHRERLSRRADLAARRAPTSLERSEGLLRARADRLGPVAVAQLERRDEQVRAWRRLLAAYDVDRQLERGYSLTTTADGALVRGVGDVAGGQEIVTRLADGTVRSTVSDVEPVDPAEKVEKVERVDVRGDGSGDSGADEDGAT